MLLGDTHVVDPIREALGKGARPVGRSIAAVIAITSERRSPTSTSASENTSVHPRPPEDSVSPVVGSMRPTAWN